MPLRSLRWPLPAFAAWLACWTLLATLRWLGAVPAVAVASAALAGLAFAAFAGTRWRRVCVAIGFPLSFGGVLLATAWPAWVWLAPLVLLALLFPAGAWRDAPLFPTPRRALAGLSRLAPVNAGGRILDAGCGLGDALRELHREYPNHELHGWEWSWPLRLWCGWRCRYARVRRADIWAEDWSDYGLVYVFQRSDSMARVAAKAERELRPGRWLASLEFAVPGVAAERTLHCEDGRRVWLYRAPFRVPHDA